MDFKCKTCGDKFGNIEQVIDHLKNVHRFKEHDERIACFVDFVEPNHCQKGYLTYGGLRNHVKTCVQKKRKHDQESVNSTFVCI